MNILHNEILLRYRRALVLPEGNSNADGNKILGLLAEISQFGYTLDGDVIRVLSTYNDDELYAVKEFLVTNLKELIGANVKYVPLFKNFPTDVPDETFLSKRILNHFMNLLGFEPEDGTVLSCGHVVSNEWFEMSDFNGCPICGRMVDEIEPSLKEYPELKDVVKGKIITLGTEEDVYDIFSNLIASKTSISSTDKETIEKIFMLDKNPITHRIPDEIPMKENVALVAGLLLKYLPDSALSVLSKHIKTATDVLRFATQLSGGDVSLKENTKFKLKNQERNLIMGLLNEIKNPLEDMRRYRSRWLRLGEVLHVGTKKNRFPNAYWAFNVLRNNESSIGAFNKEVERQVDAIKNTRGCKKVRAIEELSSLLQKRPGEFARRLDFILRNCEKEKVAEGVLAKFQEVVGDVAPALLLQMRAYMKTRTEKASIRYFLPKGKIAKAKVTYEDNRNVISAKIVGDLQRIIENELMKRYENLGQMGRVYIDPELKNILVPFSQRSSSKALETFPRGSRLSIDSETSTVRMFIWWKDVQAKNYLRSRRVDVDLSAVSYDDEWKYLGHVSYTNLKSGSNIHSGDITSAPKGAAEFIDIDIEKALKRGERYIVMNVLSYTNQPFDDFECYAGVMERQKPGSGEPFEAKTVKNKFDISGKARLNIPLVFDLKNRQAIIGDFSMPGRCRNFGLNVESNIDGIVATGQIIEDLINTKANLYDLFMLHAKARDAVVDTVFDEEVEYDLVLNIDVAKNVDDIAANWI